MKSTYASNNFFFLSVSEKKKYEHLLPWSTWTEKISFHNINENKRKKIQFCSICIWVYMYGELPHIERIVKRILFNLSAHQQQHQKFFIYILHFIKIENWKRIFQLFFRFFVVIRRSNKRIRVRVQISSNAYNLFSIFFFFQSKNVSLRIVWATI